MNSQQCCLECLARSVIDLSATALAGTGLMTASESGDEVG